MPNNAQEDIVRMRQEKLQVYQGYLTATLLLKEALQNAEMALVAQLLTDREKLAVQVDRLDQQLSCCEQSASHPSLTDRNRLDEAAVAMADILRSLVTANKDCEALAVSKSAELSDNLLKIRQQEAGLHGYAAQPQRWPVFLNVRF